MADIHWYPGHMKKASNQIEEKLKLVDCVIELLDARIPLSSRNDELFNLTKNKKRLVLLTKNDLADPIITSNWIKKFSDDNFKVLFVNLYSNNDIKKIISEVENIGSEKKDKLLAKGMKKQPIRAMIIGIPNVGKSTLINKLANKKAAGVENKPGYTKSQQWIKVSDNFELLDTPGILQSNYKDKQKAINLALCGSINENILPNEFLANYLLDYLKQYYPRELIARYKFTSLDVSNESLLEEIAKKRGFLLKGKLDVAKAQFMLLSEFKNGKIAHISLERI